MGAGAAGVTGALASTRVVPAEADTEVRAKARMVFFRIMEWSGWEIICYNSNNVIGIDGGGKALKKGLRAFRLPG